MAAITSLVVTTLATGYQAYSANKSAKAQRRGQRIEQRRADIANARERRATVRAGRVARAQVEAQAATSGVGGSSTTAGAVSGIQQQLGSNLSFLDQNQQLSARSTAANLDAAKWMSKANTAGAVAEVAGGVFSRTGGVGYKKKQPGAN